MAQAWYAMLGALLAGYFALAGFDYGVGLTLPAVGREDAGRRGALNALGAYFLGNEVWIVAAVGVLLAAFPRLEGELFAAAYPLVLAMLLGLVAINAGVQLRGRARRGRRALDRLVVGGSALLAAGWGLLLGNLLTGVPLEGAGRVRAYAGLVDWYPLLTGACLAVLFALHGCAFLALRADGMARVRARRLARRLVVPAASLVVAAVAGAAAHPGVRHAVAQPLAGAVLAGVLLSAVLAAGFALRARRGDLAVVATGLAAALPVLAIGAALYPAVLVSTVDPSATVTVASGAAGDGALRLLTVAALPLLPALMAVQAANWWLFARPRAAGAARHW